MQIENYIQKKFSGLKEKLRSVSKGHNKPVGINAEIKCVHLTEAEDGLIEIEVRDGESMGWIYREDVEFLAYETLDGRMILKKFKDVRSMVESIAKKNGKQYCENPTKHHIHKSDVGQVYYYITKDDLLTLNNTDHE